MGILSFTATSLERHNNHSSNPATAIPKTNTTNLQFLWSAHHPSKFSHHLEEQANLGHPGGLAGPSKPQQKILPRSLAPPHSPFPLVQRFMAPPSHSYTKTPRAQPQEHAARGRANTHSLCLLPQHHRHRWTPHFSLIPSTPTAGDAHFKRQYHKPSPRERPHWCWVVLCIYHSHVHFSPRSGARSQSTGVNLRGKFGRLSLCSHPRSFREPPASPHRRERYAAPQQPPARRVPHSSSPRRRTPPRPQPLPDPRAEGSDPLRPPARPHQPPAGAPSASLACGRPPPPPSPNQQINTTFYEKKTNFSDVTHLWCKPAPGKGEPARGQRGEHGESRPAPHRTDAQPAQ